MIKSFACRDTEKLFKDLRVRRFQAFERQARKRLMVLHAAPNLEALMLKPRQQISCSTGRQKRTICHQGEQPWRVCFEWHEGDAYGVEIVDYH